MTNLLGLLCASVLVGVCALGCSAAGSKAESADNCDPTTDMTCPSGYKGNGNGDVASSNPPPSAPSNGKGTTPDGGSTTFHASNASDAGDTCDADDAGDSSPATEIESVTLLDTSQTGNRQGTPVPGFDPIPANASISLGQVRTLSIRANVSSAVGSIGFVYNGNNHTENAAPYTLCGDNGSGTVTDCHLMAGTLEVTATPFSGAARVGLAGTPATVTITIEP
jgi:hypothetical protein